jgi:hypothetical protein
MRDKPDVHRMKTASTPLEIFMESEQGWNWIMYFVSDRSVKVFVYPKAQQKSTLIWLIKQVRFGGRMLNQFISEPSSYLKLSD